MLLNYTTLLSVKYLKWHLTSVSLLTTTRCCVPNALCRNCTGEMFHVTSSFAVAYFRQCNADVMFHAGIFNFFERGYGWYRSLHESLRGNWRLSYGGPTCLSLIISWLLLDVQLCTNGISLTVMTNRWGDTMNWEICLLFAVTRVLNGL